MNETAVSPENEQEKLVAKQTELKKKLANGAYPSLTTRFLDGSEKLIQKVTRDRNPLPLWYKGTVYTLLVWLLSLLIILIFPSYTFPQFDVVLAGVTIMLVTSIGVILTHEMYDLLMKMLQYTAVDNISSIADLDKLDHWLRTLFNLRKQLFFSTIMTLIIVPPIIFLWNQIRGGATFDTMLVAFIVVFQGVSGFYIIAAIFWAPGELLKYQFNIYALDPASSELVQRLSGALNRTMFVLAVLLAIITYWLFSFTLLGDNVSIFIILLTWLLIILVFINGHYSLATIIRRVKWKKLNELQDKITAVERTGDLTSKETTDALKNLMDYHDRIRNTRNSAFDVRSGLGFINSALLPLLAFLLANITDVIGFFSRLFAGP